ncbi:MAG: hypothetical protein BWY00_01732 [Firmicutes bacterium ADurb.Bin153]|nr:MAG: hypothetical protein BWY00_01732 [Firmicutes bacterium ADurb.Bin153]
MLFMCLGGMVMIRRLISPLVTASRCSQMAAMCHPPTYGEGSMYRHKALMKNARSFSARALSMSLLSPCLILGVELLVEFMQLSKFILAQFGIIRLLVLGLYGSAVRA